MDDAAPVCGGEGVGGLAEQVQRAGPGERRGCVGAEHVVEVVALEQLHCEEDGAARGLAEVGDLHDVGVADLRGGLGLAAEAVAELGIGGEPGGEDLDGDLGAEAKVLGLVDGAHAALAEGPENAIAGADDGVERGHGSR